MAASPVVVFQTLASKDGQTPRVSSDLAEGIRKQDGFQGASFGLKMEDPDTGIFCTEWSSRESATSYLSSLGTSVEAKETLLIAMTSPSRRALEAPCTEIFTAFGAEEGFMEAVGRFVAAVEKTPPVGYLGAQFGESTGGDGDGDKAVRMLLGWTSKEAHLEAKGAPGAIQDNIHELRALRKAVDLFHVQFKKL
ncbi:hypothetical protein VTK26DRAFT_3161 [Humicola hyalothermophila]